MTRPATGQGPSRAGNFRAETVTTSQLVTNLSSLPKKSRETSAFLTVTVNNPADSSRYTPVLLAAKIQVGKAIAASSLIANFASLPAGSQASYLMVPDFANAEGHIPG
ncbi:hypothetical protein [Lactobacillus delbrueckii]|uniref:hypothetical protein n=1 Tax=Lactobacillus delbrueckii TaxID=1584 RepID=UPI0023E3FA68|nr:hypothetical protein [Lactobacillus delbrueckii]MDF4030350.1 hypothetical protein [Lactobacillus delbrueckii]